jgi:two-component system sensor histidine kinase ChvG
LVGVFIAVPVALYYNFHRAEQEQRELLQQSVLKQGLLVAAALEPLLAQTDPSPLPVLGDELKRFADLSTRIRILLRPVDKAGVDSFFYVASAPAVAATALTVERDELVRQGILDNVAQTCIGNQPLANRYRDPDGREEVLTSLIPLKTATGCWVVVVSHPIESLLGSSLGQPYWTRVEVRIAGAVYLVMALLTFGVFWSIRRGMLRFRAVARALRTGDGTESFAERNDIAELSGVAEEFDRLIQALRNSADRIRQAAEDNTHAFKTPIAIIRQSLEPLKRIVPLDEARGRRALTVLESSIERLDQLVSTARRMDEAVAELLYPPNKPVDLSQLLQRMVLAYGNLGESRGVRLTAAVDSGMVVRASDELLETVVENIFDNAVSVSPRGAEIAVTLRRTGDMALLTIRDQGPGVPAQDLERIFERRYTKRPEFVDVGNGDSLESLPHTGIGLWIVRRNVEAVGGRVWAEAAPAGGLIMNVRLPLDGKLQRLKNL